MTSARATLEGPFTRSLREALEAVASADVSERVIESALVAGGRLTVPEDVGPFRAFVEGPLRAIVVQTLGAGEYDVVAERLAHVLRMASSAVTPRPARPSLDPAALPLPGVVPSDAAPYGAGEDAERWEEEPSQIRAAGAVRERRPSPAATPLARVRHDDARPRVRAEVTAPREPAPARSRGAPSETLRPPELGPSQVVLITLDPLLAADTEARLAQRSRVTVARTSAELLAAIEQAEGSLALVVDAALPAIDLPTVASIAAGLPPATRVVLWGMSERQRDRLAGVFPIARSWIAGGAAASPADLLVRSS